MKKPKCFKPQTDTPPPEPLLMEKLIIKEEEGSQWSE